MINGAHAIIYSRDADADRGFFQDVLKLPSVDVGGGWLIFGLPPSEVAVHPTEGEGSHELYLMCEDVAAFVKVMTARGMPCGPVQNQGWGLLTEVTLPGGGKLGVYQPRHGRPPSAGAPAPAKSARRKPAAKKPARKVTKKLAKKRTKKAVKRSR
jgi:hypothetical protein